MFHHLVATYLFLDALLCYHKEANNNPEATITGNGNGEQKECESTQSKCCISRACGEYVLNLGYIGGVS